MDTDPLENPNPQELEPQNAPTRNTSPRRRFPLSNLQIILIALIVVGGRLALDFSQRIIEGQTKISEQQDLEQELADLRAEQRVLEAEKAYYSSSTFIEAWAHDEGKMVRNGERLIVPVYQDVPEAPQQASAPADEPVTLPGWQVWWTLFFDSAPAFNINSGS